MGSYWIGSCGSSDNVEWVTGHSYLRLPRTLELVPALPLAHLWGLTHVIICTESGGTVILAIVIICTLGFKTSPKVHHRTLANSKMGFMMPGSGASLSLAEEGATVQMALTTCRPSQPTIHHIPTPSGCPSWVRSGLYLRRAMWNLLVITSRTVYCQITSLMGLPSMAANPFGEGVWHVHSGGQQWKHV